MTIRHPLYQGKVMLDFQSGRHAYHVYDEENNLSNAPVMGVTTVIRTLAKEALIGWAAGVASDDVSESLNRCLMQNGMISAEDIKDAAERGKTAYARRRDTGANFGSMFHAWSEEYDKRGALAPEPDALIKKAADAYKEWVKENVREIIEIERPVYSRKYRFAGTPDRVWRLTSGELVIPDLKTTNISRDAPKGIYGEMFIQTGAYALARAEEFGPEITGLQIVNVSKGGKINIATNKDLKWSVEACGELFVKTLELNQALKEFKFRLGGR